MTPERSGCSADPPLLAVPLTAVLVLASCGGSESGSSPTPTATSGSRPDDHDGGRPRHRPLPRRCAGRGAHDRGLHPERRDRDDLLPDHGLRLPDRPRGRPLLPRHDHRRRRQRAASGSTARTCTTSTASSSRASPRPTTTTGGRCTTRTATSSSPRPRRSSRPPPARTSTPTSRTTASRDRSSGSRTVSPSRPRCSSPRRRWRPSRPRARRATWGSRSTGCASTRPRRSTRFSAPTRSRRSTTAAATSTRSRATTCTGRSAAPRSARPPTATPRSSATRSTATPVHSPFAEGEAPDDLDECNGHTTEAAGYHYHANPAAENQVIACLVGQTAESEDAAGGPPTAAARPARGRLTRRSHPWPRQPRHRSRPRSRPCLLAPDTCSPSRRRP